MKSSSSVVELVMLLCSQVSHSSISPHGFSTFHFLSFSLLLINALLQCYLHTASLNPVLLSSAYRQKSRKMATVPFLMLLM